MSTFTRWIKQTLNELVDPDKETRIDQLDKRLQYFIANRRNDFTLDEALQGVEYRADDLEEKVTRAAAGANGPGDSGVPEPLPGSGDLDLKTLWIGACSLRRFNGLNY